jgi:predicted membrane GTPase involved in stress response
MCNSSPLAGKEGTQSTFPVIKQRLEKEVETNISLSLRKPEGGGEALEVMFKVCNLFSGLWKRRVAIRCFV